MQNVKKPQQETPHYILLDLWNAEAVISADTTHTQHTGNELEIGFLEADCYYIWTGGEKCVFRKLRGGGGEVDINKKTENQAKMTKLSMEWKRLCKIKAKVRVNTEESAVKPEPELKNTIGCNLNPSDGPGKPNSIIMKTVKTKWALNHLQQPICVHLTKTVKTLKAQS
ncbi:hypothetical protein Tco_0481455 [Tanacetum coccineum]